MLFENKYIHKISLSIIVLFIAYLIYLFIPSFIFVKDHHLGLDDGKYVHKVNTKQYIVQKAQELTKECKTKLCEVQSILNYVTNIEYKINNSITMSPKKTIEVGFGDCDDKSNLLISLLKVRGFDVYFVLVPKHIFTIIALDDTRLSSKKALLIDGKKYYILESTAKNSSVGFPLKYKLNEIEAIVDPFENEKLEYKKLEFR